MRRLACWLLQFYSTLTISTFRADAHVPDTLLHHFDLHAVCVVCGDGDHMGHQEE